jgi:adenylate cyclase class 2
MQYEVELKFRLSDPTEVLQELGRLQAKPQEDQLQVDQYFAHPSRDFAVTDEALRIRSIGDENRVTYKGPVVDRATKTRHESELGFEPGSAAAEQLAQIWEQLGFRRVRIVRKQRRTFLLTFQSHNLEICFDQVDGLGSFLEIETLASSEEKELAQQTILAFAELLKLPSSEPRSYLAMLLDVDQAGANES